MISTNGLIPALFSGLEKKSLMKENLVLVILFTCLSFPLMTLTEIKKVLREEHTNAVKAGVDELTPVQKFQVFEEVLKGLLDRQQITETQYSKWVNVY